METLDPALKKANLKLLVGLIVFALGLTALCIVWMHFHSERIYEEQMKGPSSFYLQQVKPTTRLTMTGRAGGRICSVVGDVC